MVKRAGERVVREARPKLEAADAWSEIEGIDVAARFPGKRVCKAGEFKARCLKLMDEVQRTGIEIVITKHNRPVAKLSPITEDGIVPFVGRSRGVIQISPEDLLAPIGPDWMLGDDL